MMLSRMTSRIGGDCKRAANITALFVGLTIVL
jgi:hypothetical protein